jgi:hypothetical protein
MQEGAMIEAGMIVLCSPPQEPRIDIFLTVL